MGTIPGISEEVDLLTSFVVDIIEVMESLGLLVASTSCRSRIDNVERILSFGFVFPKIRSHSGEVLLIVRHLLPIQRFRK